MLNFDIGIAPLLDSHFNRSKSNLKWLEVAAIKAPVVASDLVTYGNIKNGVTGYLARTEDDWYKYLSKLIKNDELRIEMGNNAYCDAKRNWSVPVITKKYADVLNKVLRR